MSKTPKLRFKEFSGDWASNRLSNYADKIIKKNKDFLVTNVISNSAKNGLVSQRDFFDKDIANQNNIDGYYIIENGDFVYNPRKSLESPYGPVNRYNLEDAGVVSPLYLCFKINEKVNGKFLEYYFKSSKWYRFIYQNSDQGARHDRVSIKDSEFFKLDTKFPSIEEQDKIAYFFSLIDDKICLQGEKVEALKDYKNGMMQKIFSRALRFKDDEGRDYPEWEEKKLGECVDIFLGLTYTPTYTDTGIPFLSVKDISNGRINFDNIKYISNEEYINSTNNAKPKKGDILFGRVGTLGSPIVIKDNLDICIFVSLGYLRIKDRGINNIFIAHWMNSDKFSKQVDKKVSGSSQKNLNTGWLREFTISTPKIEEQIEISKFLDKLDKKIEKEQEKLDSLNEYKKGLLQQMFV